MITFLFVCCLIFLQLLTWLTTRSPFPPELFLLIRLLHSSGFSYTSRTDISPFQSAPCLRHHRIQTYSPMISPTPDDSWPWPCPTSCADSPSVCWVCWPPVALPSRARSAWPWPSSCCPSTPRSTPSSIHWTSCWRNEGEFKLSGSKNVCLHNCAPWILTPRHCERMLDRWSDKTERALTERFQITFGIFKTFLNIISTSLTAGILPRDLKTDIVHPFFDKSHD